MERIFKTQENFEQYQLTRLVVQETETEKEKAPRLIFFGKGIFQTHHEQFSSLLNEHNIPHIYREGIEREHNWSSGWVPEAVSLVFSYTQ